MIFESAVMDI